LTPKWWRCAEGKMPILQLELPDGRQLDLMFARSDSLQHPIMWAQALCQDGGSAAGSIRDALALRRAVLSIRGFRGWQLFQQALPRLRRWTKTRRIEGNAMGFLGGFAWALLLANTLLAAPAEDAEGLVHELQRRFSTWDWPEPVTLEGSGVEFSAPMPILCPTDSSANAARNVTVSTKEVILAELRRAAAGEAVVPREAGFAHFIRVEVTAEQKDVQDAAAWVEARLLLLVRSLDAYAVRPQKLSTGFWSFGASASRDILDRAVQDFEERLAGDSAEENFYDLIEIAVESRDEIKQRLQEKGSPAASPQPSPKLAPKAAPR